MKFYKEADGDWIINGEIIPAGTCRQKTESATGRITIKLIGAPLLESTLALRMLPTQFQDVNGNYYADLAAYEAATSGFFVDAALAAAEQLDIDLGIEVQTRTSGDANLQNQINAVASGYLGAIAYNASAPTPAKNGWYDFSTGGVVSWLTGTPTVKIGDRVSVLYTAPSTYVYTYQNINLSGTIIGDNTIELQNIRTNSKSQKFPKATDRISYLEGLVDTQYTNKVWSTDLVGIYPSFASWATVDNGAAETLCAAATTLSYPNQIYRINFILNHKYLFLAKIKGTTITNTSFSLLGRYATTGTSAVNAVFSTYQKSITKTAPFDYTQMAVLVTPTNGAYSILDFTISLAQAGKDSVWAYKEVEVIDVTGLSGLEIQSIIDSGYVQFGIPYLRADRLSDDVKLPKARWSGKNILAIGDSLTEALKWQSTVSALQNCNITTHAKGGISFIPMVDGDNAETSPILPLSIQDVTGKDLVVLFGGMNERSREYGFLGDIYPANNTLYGRLQYIINKLYSLLKDAGNLTCKILIVTPHCCGKYGYIDVDGYGIYPDGTSQTLEIMCNNIKLCSNYNNLRVVDLWHNSGIGKNTWSVYSASTTSILNTPDNNLPYPNNSDQVHLSDVGYARIGEVISYEMDKI